MAPIFLLYCSHEVYLRETVQRGHEMCIAGEGGGKRPEDALAVGRKPADLGRSPGPGSGESDRQPPPHLNAGPGCHGPKPGVGRCGPPQSYRFDRGEVVVYLGCVGESRRFQFPAPSVSGVPGRLSAGTKRGPALTKRQFFAPRGGVEGLGSCGSREF